MTQHNNSVGMSHTSIGIPQQQPNAGKRKLRASPPRDILLLAVSQKLTTYAAREGSGTGPLSFFSAYGVGLKEVPPDMPKQRTPRCPEYCSSWSDNPRPQYHLRMPDELKSNICYRLARHRRERSSVRNHGRGVIWTCLLLLILAWDGSCGYPILVGCTGEIMIS